MPRRWLTGQVGGGADQRDINAPQNELKERVAHDPNGQTSVFRQEGRSHIPSSRQDQCHGPTVWAAALSQQVPCDFRNRMRVFLQQALGIDQDQRRLSSVPPFELVEFVQCLRVIGPAPEAPHCVGGIEDHATRLQGAYGLNGVLTPRRLLQCFRRHVATLS